MVVGTSGPASTDAIYPNVLNYLHGLKFKVVGGYKSATDTHLAMERGEVDGRCGISYDTLVALNGEWLTDKKVRILVQIGLRQGAAARRHPIGVRSRQDRRAAPDLGAVVGAAADGTPVFCAARDGA